VVARRGDQVAPRVVGVRPGRGCPGRCVVEEPDDVAVLVGPVDAGRGGVAGLAVGNQLVVGVVAVGGGAGAIGRAAGGRGQVVAEVGVGERGRALGDRPAERVVGAGLGAVGDLLPERVGGVVDRRAGRVVGDRGDVAVVGVGVGAGAVGGELVLGVVGVGLGPGCESVAVVVVGVAGGQIGRASCRERVFVGV